MIKKYKAMVLSCIDPRFQPIIYNYLKKKRLNGKYSSFTIAGSAIGVNASKFRKWHKTFWDNLENSIRDCGAAKIINGKKTFDYFRETKIHKSSLNKIKKRFKNKYPKLNIETILISLNKSVEKF